MKEKKKEDKSKGEAKSKILIERESPFATVAAAAASQEEKEEQQQQR